MSLSNLAGLALRTAAVDPERTALVVPLEWDDARVTRAEALSFGALAARVAALRSGLAAAGLRPGDRVVLLFPVGADLFALVLALLASGLVAVFIDTGMSRGRVLSALKAARAQAIVSVRALLRHRWWLPALWGMRRYAVDAQGLGLRPFRRLVGAPDLAPPVPRDADDHALVTYTSGSTGQPRGADRSHGALIAQHRALLAAFPVAADEVDMPAFPMVVLHNLCCGVPTILPPLDFKAPASVQPAAVFDLADAHGVTRMTGAPAYLARLVDHAEAMGRTPGRLRALGVGGAPISAQLCQRFGAALPGVEGVVIYGSTEAEPIAFVSMAEVAASEGEGILVGCCAPGAEVELVDLPDLPPPLDARGVAPWRAALGEVVVRGDHVLPRYLNDPEADRRTKLPDPRGGVWHRTGDVARRDEQGRLWLVGRVLDAVPRPDGGTLHPFPVEARLNAHPLIERAALVAHPAAPHGEVAVQPDDPDARAAAARILRDLGLTDLGVRGLDALPVDVRHNSKIDRVALRTRLAGG